MINSERLSALPYREDQRRIYPGRWFNRLRWGLAPLIVVCAFAAPIDAFGEEWKINSSGTASLDFDDNVNLEAGNGGESAVTATLVPVVSVDRKAETLDLSLQGTVRLVRHYGIENHEGENPSLNFNATKRFEKATASLNTAYQRQSTRQSELADTGLINTQSVRQSISIDPGLSYQLTERDNLSFNAGVNAVAFSGGENGQFNNFRSYSWQSTWSRQSSENFRYQIILNGSYFRPSAGVASDTYGFLTGRNWMLTEKLSLDTLGGIRYQIVKDLPGAAQNSGGIGTQFQASLTYSGEVTTISGSLNRAVSPSAGGRTLETDTVGVAVSHQLSETLSVSFSANGTLSRPSGGDTNTTTRQFYSLAPSLSWRINERLSLTADLQHRSQSLNEGDSAQSNSAGISLHFALP